MWILEHNFWAVLSRQPSALQPVTGGGHTRYKSHWPSRTQPLITPERGHTRNKRPGNQTSNAIVSGARGRAKRFGIRAHLRCYGQRISRCGYNYFGQVRRKKLCFAEATDVRYHTSASLGQLRVTGPLSFQPSLLRPCLLSPTYLAVAASLWPSTPNAS